MADRVAVMYLGRIVETGDHVDVTGRPAHPYTQALIRAVPVIDPRRHRIADKQVLAGDVPSPIDPPPGCAFHTRCPFVFGRCRTEIPRLRAIGWGRSAACHLQEPAAPVPSPAQRELFTHERHLDCLSSPAIPPTDPVTIASGIAQKIAQDAAERDRRACPPVRCLRR